MATTDLVLAEPVDAEVVRVLRPPDVVLREAHEAAVALRRVWEGKAHKVVIGDQDYLEYEDWQTVGKFYGIAARVVSSAYVQYGPATGWEARAEAVHVESQKVVSAADAMCLNDEEKWSGRPRYEWHYTKKSGGTSAADPGRGEIIWEKGPTGRARPKRERVAVGTEPVPMFQLRSMAQTRACAKALRNALAWVVVLAGYRPTPAEEMDSLANQPPAPPPPAGPGNGAPEGPGAPEDGLEDLARTLRQGTAPDAAGAPARARTVAVPADLEEAPPERQEPPDLKQRPAIPPVPDPAPPTQTALALKRSIVLAIRDRLRIPEGPWRGLVREHAKVAEFGTADMGGLERLERALEHMSGGKARP